MPFRRVEILLPRRYNDRSRIPNADHVETLKEIYNEFGALTFLRRRRGFWKDEEGENIFDRTIPLIVDIPSDKVGWFSKKKAEWEERYKQDMLYIVHYDIEKVSQ